MHPKSKVSIASHHNHPTNVLFKLDNALPTEEGNQLLVLAVGALVDLLVWGLLRILVDLVAGREVCVDLIGFELGAVVVFPRLMPGAKLVSLLSAD